MPKKGTTYYAIHRGRTPGVVRTWPECQTRITGFPGARYKKFNNQLDADYYLEHGVSRAKTTAPNSGATSIMDFIGNTDTDVVHVYTDGSCLHNGTKRAVGGYGVWFNQGDPRNISNYLRGKPTNNRAELTAILEALGKVTSELQAGTRIVIHTDSEYSMKCFGEYGRKMESRQWKGLDGNEIPNRDLITRGLPLFRKYNNISLRYIKAHTAETDRHSFGNRMADQLAVAGAKMALQ
jgi:ribonuclease HI